MRTMVAVTAVIFTLATQVSAQQPRSSLFQRLSDSSVPKVYRMEVINGTRKCVTYHSTNLSAQERAILANLADAESDTFVAVIPTVHENGELAQVAARVPTLAEIQEQREHKYNLALAQASGSPRLRRALGLPEPKRAKTTAKPTAEIRPAAAVEGVPTVAVIFLREGNQRIECKKWEENGMWVIVTTTSNTTLKIRATDILRIEDPTR